MPPRHTVPAPADVGRRAFAHGRHTRAVLGVACAVFVVANTIADHFFAGQPATLHHSRPAVLLLPTLLFAIIAWRYRHQLTDAGQVGAVFCLAGTAANSISMLTEQAGVADYVNIPLGNRYVFSTNPADIAIITGLAIVAATVLNARRSGSEHRTSTEHSGATQRQAESPNVVVLSRHLRAHPRERASVTADQAAARKTSGQDSETDR